MKGDLYTTPDRPYATAEEVIDETRGKVIDLVLPIIALIICCVIGMIYTGGFFSGSGFVELFSNSDASVGLMLGSFFAFIITIIFYAVRKVLRFSESMCPRCRKDSRPWYLQSDPDICMDVKGYDRQPWRRGIRGRSNGFCCQAHICESASSHHFPGRMLPGICNRHILGDVRHPDPDCCCCICRNQRKDDDHIHLRLHGRRSLRRPLLANL